MSDFKDFWKLNNGYEFEKSRLTSAELKKVQARIELLQKRGFTASRIISSLQRMNKKLIERWKASRAFWTETKKGDTTLVADASKDLGIEKYRVILSPNACKICREKTENGQRVFKSEDVEKSGWGHVPPFHPNCFCILVPKV